MEKDEELRFNDLSGRAISISIRDSYIPGRDLILGISDSLEFLKKVPDESVKLVVTSPPYNIGKVYEERVKLEEYLEYRRKVAGECKRILRDDGSIAWEIGNYVYNGEIFPLDYFFYRIFKEELIEEYRRERDGT
jgi:site-specific DNA-methyltransferase (adenine-specific)/adenine-specific DNA-methyltransferase